MYAPTVAITLQMISVKRYKNNVRKSYYSCQFG